MECFTYKGRCIKCECTCTEVFKKEELAWAIDQRLQVIGNLKLYHLMMLF